MNQRQALLQSIYNNPEDNTARLVYADWLEENGESTQEEFIRGQVMLAEMDPWEPGYHTLKKNVESAWQNNKPIDNTGVTLKQAVIRDSGLDTLLPSKKEYSYFTTPSKIMPKRGFIEEIKLERQPKQDHTVEYTVKALCEFFGAREVKNNELQYSSTATHLNFGKHAHYGNFFLAFIKELSHEKSTLRFLGMLGFKKTIDYSLMQELCNCKRLASLKFLDLSGHNISAVSVYTGIHYINPPILKILADSKYIKNLEELKLTGCRIDDTTTEVLAQSENFKHLKKLDLSGIRGELNQGSSEEVFIAVKELANSPHLTNLEELNLSQNRLSDSAIQDLANSPYLHNLRILDLSRNHVYDQSVTALANSETFKNLKSLNINDSSHVKYEQFPPGPFVVGGYWKHNLTTKALREIAGSEHLSLQSLSANNIEYYFGHKEYAAEVIANHPAFAELRHLELVDVSKPEAQALAQSDNLSNLTKLILSYDKRSYYTYQKGEEHEAIQTLVESNAFKNLEYLELSEEKEIKPTSILKLAANNPNLNNLKEIGGIKNSEARLKSHREKVKDNKAVKVHKSDSHGTSPDTDPKHSPQFWPGATWTQRLEREHFGKTLSGDIQPMI